MANNWYVDSAAGGTAAGTSWTNAAVNLQQILGQICNGAFTTSSPNITLAANNGLGWVTAGTAVYDVTLGQQVGTVSTITGTALVLQGNASHASSGSADVLVFGGPTSVVAAGDSIFFHNTSAETYATSQILTLPGTSTNPNYLYSTDTTNSPPQSSDLLAGASISTTGVSNIDMVGSFYCYGVNLNGGTGVSTSHLGLGATSTGSIVHYVNCAFAIVATGANNTIIAPNALGATCLLGNCTFQFAAVGQTFEPTGQLTVVKGGSIVGSVFPTNFISTNVHGVALFEGFDFSALGSGKTLVGLTISGTTYSDIHLKDCKINSAATVAATPANPASRVFVSRTDSTGSENVFQLYNYAGKELSNTTITRVGGAIDFSGNAFSKQIVTTANVSWAFPFETLPMSAINLLVGAVRTVTVYGIWGAASPSTPPNNDQIWIEVEYPGSSSSPIGSYVNSTKANNLASGTAISSDTSTWNGSGGLTNPSPFAMSVTLTAQIAGPLTIRVYAADPSTTFYVDAKPVLS